MVDITDLLSPCICGRKPTLKAVGGRCDKHYEVVCECGIKVGSNGKDWNTFYSTELEAINAWNQKIQLCGKDK